MIITKHVEFDAGHRVPYHESVCRNAHGHRYKLDVSVSGAILPVRGETDDGMVVDFGHLKQVITESVVTPWDHAFLVYQGDKFMRDALDYLGSDHRTVVLDVVPTAENLVEKIAFILGVPIKALSLELHTLTLFETPNSWATWKR